MKPFLLFAAATISLAISSPIAKSQPNPTAKNRLVFSLTNDQAPEETTKTSSEPPSPTKWSVPPRVDHEFPSSPKLAQNSPSPNNPQNITANPSTPSTAPNETQLASTPLEDSQQILEQAIPEPAASDDLPAPSSAHPAPVTDDVTSSSQELNLAPLNESDSGQSLPPSQSVTINLINKLVQRGILTKEEAATMISQAEAEAEVARAQAQADMFAVAQIAAQQAAAEQIAMDQALSAPSENDIRVTYIPEPVKSQIKEDIKLELLEETKRKPFKDLNALPAWVSRLKPSGDVRVRFESVLFPFNNDASGAFPDFNRINRGSPFDITGNEFAPQLNADQNRYRFRLRARFGLAFDLADGFLLGMRLATGNDNSPVSTNQSLGSPNGNFSKYALWLDQAFLKWSLWSEPWRSFDLYAGRFPNPFFCTPLIWDDDLQFDGFAFSLKYEVLSNFRPFLTAGAFPVYNTAFNFPDNQPSKYRSYDKWLFAGQLGFDWEFAKRWNFKLATSYYHFHQIEGKLSSPFVPLTKDDAGDTDDSRPLFAQKGNTYFPIRSIIPDASNDFGAINQWQYYGLATKFHELAFTARLDYNGFEPIQVSLIGEFVTNLAWDKTDINRIAVNNRGELDPDNVEDLIGQYDGSGYAWYVRLQIGHPEFRRRWDWNTQFEYRWIGSDAVVDGFNDSDFGLGGTNMHGFTLSGGIALAPNVWLAARWHTSNSLAGPQFNVNIIQVDLNGKF